MKRALIIKKNWLDKIFDEGKTWEMRSRNTKIRGKIGLIESGTGLIVGEAKIVDTLRMKHDELVKQTDKHHVYIPSLLENGATHGF